MPAAMAMNPSRAISPSTKLYAGSAAMFRLIVSRLRDASTAVTECG